MYDRWQGTVDFHIKMPMDGVSGGNLLSFLESAAEHGWELCASIPASAVGQRRHLSAGPREGRVSESEHEEIDLVFKRTLGGIPKQEQFLWIVQTVILANATNLASDPESAEKFRHEISATGKAITMRAAINASQRIPKDLDAGDAADAFCGYMLTNLRAEGAQVPYWFAR